jgi:hypothetical protein
MATDTGYTEARAISEAAREKDWKLPSFGKGLYLGDFQPELISPQPELPADVVEKGERFLAALRTFLEDEVDPQEIEREGRISDEVVAGLKDVGALGMKVPEEYGGLGLSQVYYNRAMMLSGTCHSSISTLLSAHQSIGVAQPLLLFGSEEQKREWLPKVSTTHLSAFALTSPAWAPTPPGCRPPRRPPRTARATSSTAASCGRPTGPWPTSSSCWPRCPAARVAGAASPPSSSRARPTAWSSRRASSSWGFAVSRTPRPGTPTPTCRART